MRNMERDFASYLKMIADGKGQLQLPGDDFNVRDITVTNLLNVNDQQIFANVHFLLGYDDGSEMFTTSLSYKVSYQSDEKTAMDLYCISGNTYLFKEFKIRKEKTIDNTPLYSYPVRSYQDLVSLFAWALDTEDTVLFERCCSEDIYILRAGVNGDGYELQGIADCAVFMKKDREYYRDNLYSLVIEKESGDEVLAYHLFPANTGNKHLGSNTRYVQFFNEDVVFTISDLKIRKVIFRRKERPLVKRNQLIIL